MHVLHAIHDFPPRHQAGSEIYALELARAQLARHDVTVLCAEYDPVRAHGHVTWRVHQGVAVVEIVNNWVSATFEGTYRPPAILDRIRDLLETLRPDVVHVHNLLNLSFDLPATARALGIPVVATLHDYTLVCASGGQRVHRRDEHVCHEIDVARCAQCFTESPFHAQAVLGRVMGGPAGRVAGRAAAAARRLWPGLTAHVASAVRDVGGFPVGSRELEARLAAARQVFSDVDLFVAPSAALATEFVRLGVPETRLRVSDYGMVALPSMPRQRVGRPLRIGFVGTLVWHKGLHLLIEAVTRLPRDTWTLRIFGGVDTFPDYVAGLRTRAAGWPITFEGAFQPEQAADVYRRFDVLVVPSLWLENSPLVIHEAFQSGVAVVGARVGGIPDLVADGVSGLLYDAASPDDLARVLGQLVANPSRVAELAAAAPRVKSVAEDAVAWDARYAEVGAHRADRPS